MRLGQLSRKINTRTSDIVEYLLGAHSLEINNHPNSKIPDAYIELVERHFKYTTEAAAPKTEESITHEQNIEEITTLDTTDESDSSEKVTVIAENKDSFAATEIEEIVDLNIVDGVIKAPKIEVTGVKVVGKIDLPETKSEEPDVSNENTTNEATDQLTEEPIDVNDSGVILPQEPLAISSEENKPRKKHPRRDSKTKRSSHKQQAPILTPEEERRIKLKEAQKKRQEEKQNAKAKRRENYHQEIKAKNKKSESKKLKKRKAEKLERENKIQKPKPKSLWGKFIYWLND